MSSRDRTILSPGIAWVPVIGPSNYPRQPPTIHNAHSPDPALHAWLLGEFSRPQMEVPEQGIYALQNGYASDLTFVYGDDRSLVAASATDHAQLYQFDEIRALDPRGVPQLPGEMAFLFKAGKNNFGHILVEILPRLETLLAAGYQGLPLLMPILPPAIAMLVKQVVDRVYDGSWPLRSMSTPLVQVEQLIYPSPVTRHNDRKSAAVAAFATRVLSRMTEGRAGSPLRIYVSRRGCTNRPLINESEIEALFASSGFTIVRPEDHDFETQVVLFRRAELIAGPIGAAMTSIMFAPPSASILMLDPGTHDLFFYDLACLRGQSFAWAFAGPLVRTNAERLHAPWSMRLDVVESALRTLLE